MEQEAIHLLCLDLGIINYILRLERPVSVILLKILTSETDYAEQVRL